MEDIRAIEKETQDLLKKKMANPDACSEDGEYKPGYDLETDLDVSSNNASPYDNWGKMLGNSNVISTGNHMDMNRAM